MHPLYTPEAAAGVLKISRTRVFELMKSGEIASIKIGRSRRITDEAIASYVSKLSAIAKAGQTG